MQQPHVVTVAVEETLTRVTRQPVQRAGLDDFVFQRRALRINRLDGLPQQRRGIHIRHFFRITTLRIVEIRRAAGDAEQILRWIQVEKTEALLVGGPDELAGRGIPPHADAVGGLDQDGRAGADLANDFAVDLAVAAVLSLCVTGMHMDLSRRQPHGNGRRPRRFPRVAWVLLRRRDPAACRH